MRKINYLNSPINADPLRNVIRLASIIGLILMVATGARAEGNRQPLFVMDPSSGLIADGFDVVSFFIEGQGKKGNQDHELLWGNGYWHFISERNKEIFQNAPYVYAPQFGGHDVVSLSSGITVVGSPLIWKIAANRLFFFSTKKNAELFIASPESFYQLAFENWKAIEAKPRQPAQMSITNWNQ